VFAKKLREEIVTLAAKHCYRCDVNHPSQTQHTCLMRTESEHLDVYLEEVFERYKDCFRTIEVHTYLFIVKAIAPSKMHDIFSGFVYYFDFG
jgi:hypothetical protein